MKISKLHILPLVTIAVVFSTLALKVPVAQSSDLDRSDFASDSSEVSDEILDRTVLEEEQVLLVQTESRGVEPIREAKIVTLARNGVVIVEDSNGEVIRAFQSLGVDLITYAVMSEAEALQLLEAGGGIVEPAEE